MEDIVIRECTAIEEFDSCVRLQREVFGLPELEVSPRRHLIVSRQAGGWTLGAFVGERLVGFVHHLAAVRHGNEIFGYSHMMAVDPGYQNKGVGARLKWSQRERALGEGRSFIKWTWDPMQARNAHFNLNRLGVTVTSYAVNFYGTDYPATVPIHPGSKTMGSPAIGPGIDSDRLFAHWLLQSRRVQELANGDPGNLPAKPVATIAIPDEWTRLSRENPGLAKEEQRRVRREFEKAFEAGLVCAGFERSLEQPRYLLYESQILQSV
ncbi:MAG: GNAT family N-acetyltransferase [Acidobacteriota bacterium]|nr:GNAT family N-acetyltransferase [Acidobacteriota bacterium]